MLRLTELKLPLDHEPDALTAAVLARLKVMPDQLVSFSVFRRGWDARKRSAIQLIYTVDAEVQDEGKHLQRLKGVPHVGVTPAMAYKPVTRAPAKLPARPLVIGAGPCGLFAALILAEMGFRPIILERGKLVRERTKDTWGLWRGSKLDPESNVQFGVEGERAADEH